MSEIKSLSDAINKYAKNTVTAKTFNDVVNYETRNKVKLLRDKTNCGLKPSKEALDKCDGDLLLAEGYLKYNGCAINVRGSYHEWVMEKAHEFKQDAIEKSKILNIPREIDNTIYELENIIEWNETYENCQASVGNIRDTLVKFAQKLLKTRDQKIKELEEQLQQIYEDSAGASL